VNRTGWQEDHDGVSLSTFLPAKAPERGVNIVSENVQVETASG